MHFIEIVRLTSSMTTGSRGVMLFNGEPFLVTLELPWRMNTPFKSCILPGNYLCERYTSPRYKETFIILDVYHRDRVLFHIGNFLRDTDGCVCVGLSFGQPGESALIRDSRIAFERFMDAFSDYRVFNLRIRNAF